MKQLENNQWMLINNIVFQINSIEDLTEMRKNFLNLMKLILNFDCADFYMASHLDSHELIEPVYYNYYPKGNENYMERYDGIDYSKGLMFGGKSKVYRESDIISDDTRMKTKYYKKYFEPNGWHYALNMILAYKNKFLGVVTFFRTKEKGDFEYRDVFILDIIKEHLALRLYNNLKGGKLNKISVSNCAAQYKLTKKEEMVLKNLMEGLDNEEISRRLFITVNTLKKHILNIYRKMNIKNRVQLFKLVKEKE